MLAYESDAHGIPEVFVSPTDGDGRWQISNGGGTSARWSYDGSQLFYMNANALWAATFSAAGDRVVTGKPRRLFAPAAAWSGYTTTKDGFLAMRTPESSVRSREIQVVLNWARELRP